MTERDALLAAIRATPDDDTPRLVFADWLDEHEPDAPRRAQKAKAAAPSAWAALIRAECELARLTDDGSAAAAMFRFFSKKDDQAIEGVRWPRVEPGVARRVELTARANKLRRPAEKARDAGLPRANVTGAKWSVETHRGFPGGVWINDALRSVIHIGELVAACPPVRVVFPPFEEPPPILAACGVLKWCREAVVSGRHAAFIHALSSEPDVANVKALTYHHVLPGTADAIATAVAESPHWSGLREVTFETPDPLSAVAAERLFGAKHLRGLTKVAVQGTGWTADTLAAFDHLTNLRELALSYSGLDDDAAVRLAATPAIANLRFLNLSNNRIGGRGASALLASPHLKNLAVLDLDDNRVRGLDRAALAAAPAGGLRVVGFHGSRLTVNDITALTTSPRLSDLMYFDADRNGLPESAVARLVKGFGSRAPAVLYLAGNGIGDAGIEALTNWPAAAQIDMLHLIGNYLPTTAAKQLAACPHLKGLTHLCAGTAHAAGRKALQARFGKRAIV